jgi:hypothetical protein
MSKGHGYPLIYIDYGYLLLDEFVVVVAIVGVFLFKIFLWFFILKFLHQMVG